MTAEELLEQMENEVQLYAEQTEYCLIDAENRTIQIPETYSILGVESDEKVERILFKCPKIVGDNIDLSQLSIRVNYRNANGQIDKYVCDDVQEVEEGYITFSWELWRKVTKYKGIVNFIVCAVKANSDGTITNEWNTTLAQSNVLEGLEPEDITPEEEEQARDLLTQLLSIMNTTKDSAVTEITQTKDSAKQEVAETGDAKKEEITNEGVRVLATIPSDYTALSELADELDRTRAPGIVCTAKGEQLSVTDASGQKLRGLRIYGKSRQTKTNGYQLFDASKFPSKTQGGATVTNNDDGSFTVSGSGNLTSQFGIYVSLSGEEVLKLFKSGNISINAGAKTYPCVAFSISSSNGNVLVSNNYSDKETKEINNILDGDDLSAMFSIYGNSGQPIVPGTIKPMLYQDGDGTWEPFSNGVASPSTEYEQPIENSGDSGSVGINITGNQLFNASIIKTMSQNGATIANNGDGSIYISGTELSGTVSIRYFVGNSNILHKGNITFTYDKNVMPYLQVIGCAEKGNVNDRTFTLGKDVTIEITDDILNKTKDICYLIYAASGTPITAGTIKPMLYQDGDGTWESYKEPQQLIISTPDGLPGIPVESGGNYVDANGKQLCCDYVDLNTKKYIKKTVKVEFNGYENWFSTGVSVERYYTGLIGYDFKTNATSLCNYFLYSSGGEKVGTFTYNSGNIGFAYANKGSGTTIDEWKEWLKEKQTDGNPLFVILPINNEIITDLSPEEIEAYKQLASNYPNTNVFSDTDPQAGIEMDYTADTKIYVDNKVNEAVQQAITVAMA